jgi:low temperature requirement protein LtrA
MRLLLTGLYLRALRHVPASLRPFVIIYAAGNALGAAVWLSSLLVPEPGRYAVWAAGLFVELLGPILALLPRAATASGYGWCLPAAWLFTWRASPSSTG